MSHNALQQLREELLCGVISLTPEGHRQNIRSEWQKEREQSAGAPTGRRITVDEHDKETLEIIEGSYQLQTNYLYFVSTYIDI